MNQTTVVYDGDCAFCQRTIQKMQKISSISVNFRPYQTFDLRSFNLSESECSKAMIVISPSNTVYSGAEAFSYYFIQSKFPWNILGKLMSLPILDFFSRALYKIIARNRTFFGKTKCKVH